MAATLWPDIEAATVQYLTNALAVFDAHVGAAKLEDRPVQVIVRDDGGEPLDCGFLSTARLGVQVFANSDALAERIAAHVTAALNAWADGR